MYKLPFQNRRFKSKSTPLVAHEQNVTDHVSNPPALPPKLRCEPLAVAGAKERGLCEALRVVHHTETIVRSYQNGQVPEIRYPPKNFKTSPTWRRVWDGGIYLTTRRRQYFCKYVLFADGKDQEDLPLRRRLTRARTRRRAQYSTVGIPMSGYSQP